MQAERRREPEIEHTGRGRERAVMGQPASVIGAPGPRGPEAYSAAVDMDSTRLGGGGEEEWGSWQSAPRGQMLSRSYWPVPADGERPLPSHTVLVLVNCVRLFASCSLKNSHLMQPFFLHWAHSRVCLYKSTQLNFVQNFISNV